MPVFRLHPSAVFALFFAAAVLMIGFLPSFVPMTGRFDSWQSATCKVVGAGLMFGLTWLFVRSDPAARAMLSMAPNSRNLIILLGSALVAALIILLWMLVMRAVIPFHFKTGTMTGAGFVLSVIVYLFGSVIEELAFRGVPFLQLRRSYGVAAAVAMVSLAFGFLHVLGPQALTVAGIKTIAITGMCSLVFCLGNLRTASLWAAIGLHFGMNLTLHSFLGGGDPNRASLFRLVYESPPSNWDPGFWSFIGTMALIALLFTVRSARAVPPASTAASSAV
jgi:membrane protease YdiL (CAAX protease family)